MTILLIEHQMQVVMGVCEHITVMDFGEVIARGSPQEIQANDRVIEAYLGRGAAALANGPHGPGQRRHHGRLQQPGQLLRNEGCWEVL